MPLASDIVAVFLDAITIHCDKGTFTSTCVAMRLCINIFGVTYLGVASQRTAWAI